MKRFHFLFLALIFSFSQLFSGEFKSGHSVKILDSLSKDVYSASNVLSIKAGINGDVWAAAGKAFIENSSINNCYLAAEDIIINNSRFSNLVLAGSTIKFNSVANGSLKAAGETIFISGTIERDLFVAGGTIYIEKDAVIKGDVIAASGRIVINGNIEGNVKGSFGSFELYGKVSKNVSINVDDQFYINESARIDSNLCYKSKREFDFNHILIGGLINYEETDRRDFEIREVLIFIKLFFGVSALIAVLVIVALTKNKLRKFITALDKSIIVTIVIGGVSIIAVPLLLVLLFGLVITIPLALLFMLFSFIFLMTGKLFLAIYIGDKFLYLINKKESNLYLSALTGVAVLFGSFFIPYLGFTIYALASIWGFGIACKFFYDLFSKEV